MVVKIENSMLGRSAKRARFAFHAAETGEDAAHMREALTLSVQLFQSLHHDLPAFARQGIDFRI